MRLDSSVAHAAGSAMTGASVLPRRPQQTTVQETPLQPSLAPAPASGPDNALVRVETRRLTALFGRTVAVREVSLFFPTNTVTAIIVAHASTLGFHR